MFKTPKIDFYKTAINLLPLSKREKQDGTPYNNFIAWFKGIISGFERLNGIVKNWIYGSPLNYWDSSITYNIDNQIIFNYQVYKSLIDTNLNNSPDSNPDKWELVIDLFIGIEESTKYWSPIMVLEWALNRYFVKELTDNSFVGFVQLDDPISPTRSSIYIDNVAPDFVSFVSFTEEAGTSLSFTDKTTPYFSFTTEIFGQASSYTFSVNIPTAVYSSINADSTLAEKIVRRFLDTYIPSGIVYEIITY